MSTSNSTVLVSAPTHVIIDIHTVPLYVPPPVVSMPATYIYRPFYAEFQITVIHPDEMV